MQMHARILVGSIREFQTRKGVKLPKASLKVVDMGPECGSDVVTYWIDFLGDAAVTQSELDDIVGTECTVDVRFVRCSTGKDGKAYQNVGGGAITDGEGQIVQASLRGHSQRKAS